MACILSVQRYVAKSVERRCAEGGMERCGVCERGGSGFLWACRVFESLHGPARWVSDRDFWRAWGTVTAPGNYFLLIVFIPFDNKWSHRYILLSALEALTPAAERSLAIW